MATDMDMVADIIQTTVVAVNKFTSGADFHTCAGSY